MERTDSCDNEARGEIASAGSMWTRSSLMVRIGRPSGAVLTHRTHDIQECSHPRWGENSEVVTRRITTSETVGARNRRGIRGLTVRV